MKQLMGFTQKEFLELMRTGKFLILSILFTLFGIMNPLVAKLTPWLMKTMSKELSESGMIVTEIKVDAMTSWTQFYKNIPLALIIFVIIFSGILTWEYQKGTLTILLTKGLSRWKVIASKFFSMLAAWTICYWLCYLITYLYTMYFWENHILSCLFISAFCFYLLGIWILSLILLMSVFFSSSYAVLASGSFLFLVMYFMGFFPVIKKYLPLRLMAASELLTGGSDITHYLPAVFTACALIVFNLLVAAICFNKKAL